MSESEHECVCGLTSCQCQYDDWPQTVNLHYKCDFCGKRPVAKELVIHTMPWAICRPCWDFHHLAIDVILQRHQATDSSSEEAEEE